MVFSLSGFWNPESEPKVPKYLRKIIAKIYGRGYQFMKKAVLKSHATVPLRIFLLFFYSRMKRS